MCADDFPPEVGVALRAGEWPDGVCAAVHEQHGGFLERYVHSVCVCARMCERARVCVFSVSCKCVSVSVFSE